MKMTSLILLVVGAMLVTGAAFAGVGGGDRTYSPKGAKPVFFSHENHVSIKGYKCSACHYHTFQMARDSFKMNMEKLTKGEFCGICHNGERSFDVKDQKSCVRCHK